MEKEEEGQRMKLPEYEENRGKGLSWRRKVGGGKGMEWN